MKKDANGNPMTKKRIAAYRQSFRQWPATIRRDVSDSGEGVLTNCVIQWPACGCRITGNGSLSFPLSVEFCPLHVNAAAMLLASFDQAEETPGAGDIPQQGDHGWVKDGGTP